MSAVTTQQTAGALKPNPVVGQTSTSLNLSNLVPSWLLWTVVLWENCVNLHLQAVYTKDFLAAPVVIATLKTLLLLAVAWLLQKTVRPREPLRAVLRDLVTCWFLSALAWTAWIAIYTNMFGVFDNADEANAFSDHLYDFFEEYTKVFPLIKELLNFAIETSVMLAVAIAVVVTLGWSTSKLTNSFNPNSANDSGKADEPAFRLSVGSVFIACVYVLCNSLFAWAIRV